jgi:hypothetical protein
MYIMSEQIFNVKYLIFQDPKNEKSDIFRSLELTHTQIMHFGISSLKYKVFCFENLETNRIHC